MSIPKEKNSNADLLDRLKQGFDYKTDVEIAGFLGVTKETISQVRQGVLGLSLSQRIKIMDRLASIKTRNLFERITPEHLAHELHRLSLRGAERLALDELEKGEPLAVDVRLIELFKTYGQDENLFRTDKEMASFLGLKRASISGVRTGKSRLGPLPRLRILKVICPEIDIEQIEKGIESSEYLLKLIEEHIKLRNSKKNSGFGVEE
jgi:transcriptional regulator with XRE-family HTH domain